MFYGDYRGCREDLDHAVGAKRHNKGANSHTQEAMRRIPMKLLVERFGFLDYYPWFNGKRCLCLVGPKGFSVLAEELASDG